MWAAKCHDGHSFYIALLIKWSNLWTNRTPYWSLSTNLNGNNKYQIIHGLMPKLSEVKNLMRKLASNSEISKASKSLPSSNHFVVPSLKAVAEVERKNSPYIEVQLELFRNTFSKIVKEMFTQIHIWTDKLSHNMITPCCVHTTSKYLQVKNWEFHEAHSNSFRHWALLKHQLQKEVNQICWHLVLQYSTVTSRVNTHLKLQLLLLV